MRFKLQVRKGDKTVHCWHAVDPNVCDTVGKVAENIATCYGLSSETLALSMEDYLLPDFHSTLQLLRDSDIVIASVCPGTCELNDTELDTLVHRTTVNSMNYLPVSSTKKSKILLCDSNTLKSNKKENLKKKSKKESLKTNKKRKHETPEIKKSKKRSQKNLSSPGRKRKKSDFTSPPQVFSLNKRNKVFEDDSVIKSRSIKEHEKNLLKTFRQKEATRQPLSTNSKLENSIFKQLTKNQRKKFNQKKKQQLQQDLEIEKFMKTEMERNKFVQDTVKFSNIVSEEINTSYCSKELPEKPLSNNEVLKLSAEKDEQTNQSFIYVCPPVSYESYPKFIGFPRKGERIAFKVWHFCPFCNYYTIVKLSLHYDFFVLLKYVS
jgi:hypothetical protein